FDPMGGGGVTPDVCLAFNRRCWTMDMVDRPATRPEIEPYCWDIEGDFEKDVKAPGFFTAKQKPDIIICDPPYFDNKRDDCAERGISTLPREEYLDFLERFFAFMKEHSKKTTRLACITRDWRDFENTPAAEERGEESILIEDYITILNKTGWQHTHTIMAPLSPDRFSAEEIAVMQEKRILGVTGRYVIVLN
ncbi:MAG: transcriptional regulator, partial [Deltaproteobacteria bacterium]|nr:transcriptional regulator [Deltaproteobacteria bacterium]